MRFALLRQLGALFFGTSKKKFISKAKSRSRLQWIDQALAQTKGNGAYMITAPRNQPVERSRAQMGGRLSRTRGAGRYMTMVWNKATKEIIVVLQ